MSMLVMKAVEDPRTLNKILYVRPPANMCSFSDLVGVWEEKTGKRLHKYHMPQEELVKRIQESPFPLNFQRGNGACDHGSSTRLRPDHGRLRRLRGHAALP
ncbi:hypothetical protein PR202_ga24315 [Eleusine coracana subsp. coracana]|uniref:NmrA-like domain-containing protein n=1 Tax=Eleusine coracana subsp. coracana TaxID=191504 RepID=A0AAV5D7J8_ELECO|nr:hypothetical protein PR202_ga24315 [Eleusine coracana subsp. coracana]